MSKQGGDYTHSWGPTVDLSVEIEELPVGRQLLRRWNSNAQLPICLSVKLVCADKARP